MGIREMENRALKKENLRRGTSGKTGGLSSVSLQLKEIQDVLKNFTEDCNADKASEEKAKLIPRPSIHNTKKSLGRAHASPESISNGGENILTKQIPMLKERKRLDKIDTCEGKIEQWNGFPISGNCGDLPGREKGRHKRLQRSKTLPFPAIQPTRRTERDIFGKNDLVYSEIPSNHSVISAKKSHTLQHGRRYVGRSLSTPLKSGDLEFSRRTDLPETLVANGSHTFLRRRKSSGQNFGDGAFLTKPVAQANADFVLTEVAKAQRYKKRSPTGIERYRKEAGGSKDGSEGQQGSTGHEDRGETNRQQNQITKGFQGRSDVRKGDFENARKFQQRSPTEVERLEKLKMPDSINNNTEVFRNVFLGNEAHSEYERHARRSPNKEIKQRQFLEPAAKVIKELSIDSENSFRESKRCSHRESNLGYVPEYHEFQEFQESSESSVSENSEVEVAAAASEQRTEPGIRNVRFSRYSMISPDGNRI